MKCPGKLGRGGRAGWKKRFRGVRGFKEGQSWKRGGWEVRRKGRWGRRNNDKFMWLNIFSKNFTSCTIRVEKK
jgi:hypothetical protein